MNKLFPIALVVLLVSSGCAYGGIRQVLRAEFANELDCPEVKVEKKGFAYVPDNPDAERYKLTGCGVVRTYSCPPDRDLVSYDDSECTWVEGDPDRPQMATTGGEDAFDEESEADEPDEPDDADDASDPESPED